MNHSLIFWKGWFKNVTFDKGIKHPIKLSGEHMEWAYNNYCCYCSTNHSSFHNLWTKDTSKNTLEYCSLTSQKLQTSRKCHSSFKMLTSQEVKISSQIVDEIIRVNIVWGFIWGTGGPSARLLHSRWSLWPADKDVH